MRRSLDTALAIAACVTVNAVTAPLAFAQDAVERGAELVRHVAACGQCHTPIGPDDRPLESLQLAGGDPKKVQIGVIVPPNITPDIETGIGAWSEPQIVNALRDGVRPDGSVIGPPMPVAAYRKLSDADARAIAAYLKSIPPVRRVAPKSAYVTPLPASYGPPVTHVGAPPVADQASYGAYLVGIAHCLLCHTPVANGHPDTSHPGAGGREYVDDHGYPIVSANITPDPVYGIGKWSDQEIKNAITMGINPNGGKLNSFMPSAHFSGMAEEDLNAIVAYLRTLKPIGNNKI